MNYIVGKGMNKVYKNFKIVDDLASIINILKKDDVLVLHSIEGKTLDIGIFLSEATSKGVKNIIYINKNPNQMIASAIKANNGVVETDEELLDEDSLEYIIADYDNIVGTTELAKTDGISFLTDFIEAFLNGESRVNNSMYQDRVQTALNEVVRKTEKNEVVITSISNLALDLFNDVQSSFAEQNMIRQKLHDKVTELKQSLNSQRSVNTNLGSNSIYLFPTVKYTGLKPVLHIKELVECRYLQSFLLGYMNYLEIVKHKKVKLIVCCQSFKDIISRYNTYTNITRSNVKIKRLLEERILVTQEPKKDIMYSLIDSNSDVVIVIDKMYGDNIVDGTKVKRLYSVNGISNMKRFMLKPNKCILAEKRVKDLFVAIPKIDNYPADEETRKKAYIEVCRDRYEKLDRLLEI